MGEYNILYRKAQRLIERDGCCRVQLGDRLDWMNNWSRVLPADKIPRLYKKPDI
jgi:hypothetical protein